MTVSDISAFLSNEDAQQAVTAAIGDAAGVPASAINAGYTARSPSQTRRLQRLQSGDVQVSYVIDVPSSKSVLAVAQALDAQDPKSIRSGIERSLKDAGVQGLSVSSVVDISVDVGTTTLSPASRTPFVPPEVDLASKPVLASLVACLAAVACRQFHTTRSG